MSAAGRQNAEGIDFEGKHYTLYEATQRQRSLERSIRKTKRKILIDEAAGDAEKLQWDQIRLVRTREEYHRFSKAAGLPEQYERMEKAGFTWKHGKAAERTYKTTAAQAKAIFNLETDRENVAEYVKEKSVIDMLASHGVKYIRRIDAKEIVVDAGRPAIRGITGHAINNQQTKSDRLAMTREKAQEFVDLARLTVYQQERQTLKFMAQDGYSVLNFDHDLVTAVPQKWRKKYDKYLQEEQE